MITVCHPSAAVKGAQVLCSALVCCAVKRAQLPLAALVAVLAAACATQTLPVEKLEPVRVAADVYALLGSGGEITPDNGGRTANVAFIVGPRGVVVVNTGISYAQGEAIIAAVQSVSNRPILLAILTHPGQEAIFGAAAFQARGIPVLAQRSGAELIAARCATCLRNLRATLGEEAMAGTRVVLPDRLIVGDETLELIGRPLRLIAPPWSSAPGALAVFDEMTADADRREPGFDQPHSRSARCPAGGLACCPRGNRGDAVSASYSRVWAGWHLRRRRRLRAVLRRTRSSRRGPAATRGGSGGVARSLRPAAIRALGPIPNAAPAKRQPHLSSTRAARSCE